MLNPNELQVFLAAAQARSFSEAARKLYLTQPAVSKQIQALERRLKVELFERKGGAIVLTEAGHELLPLAREMVDLSVRIEESMASRHGVVTGRLRIGCTTTPGKYILPWLTGAFCKEHPRVRIAVEVMARSDLPSRLQRQEINFGIMSGKIMNPDLLYDEVMRDDLVLVVPSAHPFAEVARVTKEQLRGETLVLREELAGTRLAMMEGLERAGVPVDALKVASIEMGAAEGVISAVEAGCGVSWVSRVAASRAIELGRIRIVEVDDLRLTREIYLVSHKSRIETDLHRRFRQFVCSPNGRAILGSLMAPAGPATE